MDNANTERSHKDTIEIWYKRVMTTQKCHYLSSARYAKYNYSLGIPVIILTAVIGTTVFANLSSQSGNTIQLFVGFGSMAALVLASLQTFLKFSEKADKYQSFGVKYGSIGRKLEILMNSDSTIINNQIDNVRQELDSLANEAPRIPLDILARARKSIEDNEKVFGPSIKKG